MTTNVGEKDRLYRAIAGVIILLWGISNANALGLIGFVVLATAYFRKCLLYIPMDVNTNKA
ncbi:DUF2892 domain-containing protein [Allochromatium humboldtianum]|uniref:DUF2892 domain-containing protein n=1 Tax=Allochromatium humboldtianum TaxID=504901 RepID=A0A850R7Z1_9GAMM|nr:DUF2892 domain-containing protein [Allochromatium humboldtianum]NVZ08496.1 DUF2892 domain-containing protein [Allochromatium humboldtianum]